MPDDDGSNRTSYLLLIPTLPPPPEAAGSYLRRGGVPQQLDCTLDSVAPIFPSPSLHGLDGNKHTTKLSGANLLQSLKVATVDLPLKELPGHCLSL